MLATDSFTKDVKFLEINGLTRELLAAPPAKVVNMKCQGPFLLLPGGKFRWIGI